MIILKGNLWDEIGEADLILFTANSVINRGNLVMGAGAALQARELFPEAPAWFGEEILLAREPMAYGIVSVRLKHESGKWWRLGAFQTKVDYREPSKLNLIRLSTQKLADRAHKFKRIALNFPGIGKGGLPREDVLALLEPLRKFDHVFIYEQ